MSTIILISSSPPKTFARSPTPAWSSSPELPSPRAILSGQFSGSGRKRFNLANAQRDGFGSGFSTARSFLQPNLGAENVSHGSQKSEIGGNKVALSPKSFKSPMTVKLDRKTNTANLSGKENDLLPIATITPKVDRKTKASEAIDTAEKESVIKVREQDFVSRKNYLSPLNLDRATTRRMDWTPPQITETSNVVMSPAASLSRSFSGGLFSSFGYSASLGDDSQTSRHENDTAPTKRRRLDLIASIPAKPENKMLPPKSCLKTANEPVVSGKKAKAPKKNPLTITGLATSNYFGNQAGQKKETPLQQFLTSTQAQTFDKDDDETALEISKPKRAARKSKASKKAAAACPLLSPESALKAMSNQDALFGSASQLAREESPSLTRDTLEAIKQSESFMMSDPFPTQTTEPISIESTTPRTDRGTSRFAKARGLWSAAGRDEDNALLHVDTIDMFDTPNIRLAFAGKDVLLQPSGPRTRQLKSPEKQSPSLQGVYLSHARTFDASFIDIDDLDTSPACLSRVTLPMIQTRAFHTSPNQQVPRRRLLSEPTEVIARAVENIPAKDKTNPKSSAATKTKLIKPSFAGFSTGELQKQLAAYHFKTVKKREKMIEMLEKCWEAKNGVGGDAEGRTEPSTCEEIEKITHRDLLSNIHGLGNRPAPKVKKPPGRPKKAKDDSTEPKEPKKRKKAEPKAIEEKAENTAKAPRKRKSKASTLSKEKVVDLDEIEEPAFENPSNIAEALAVTREVPSLPANKTVKTPVKTKAKSKKVIKPTTLPSTMPRPLSSSPDFETPITAAVARVDPISPGKDMQSQIELAITSYTPSTDRSHQREPTWHEKILMYDPIVLEDLAAWLNTTGLGKIGEDREVGAIEVRDWLEKHGVCCLWKGGWRGNKGVVTNEED